MTKEEAELWVSKQNWVYAKSYASTYPHHYTTRNRCDEFEFEQFLWLIRNDGKLKTFNSKQYIYLELGEYEYWEMGRPIKAVQVLNRALIDDTKPYRYPKPSDKEELTIKAKMNMRDAHLECLLLRQERTEEHERQLKFLLDSQRRIHGGGKNIIDHSSIKVRYE